jgi:hypothetical protein
MNQYIQLPVNLYCRSYRCIIHFDEWSKIKFSCEHVLVNTGTYALRLTDWWQKKKSMHQKYTGRVLQLMYFIFLIKNLWAWAIFLYSWIERRETLDMKKMNHHTSIIWHGIKLLGLYFTLEALGITTRSRKMTNSGLVDTLFNWTAILSH